MSRSRALSVLFCAFMDGHHRCGAITAKKKDAERKQELGIEGLKR